MNLNIYTHCHPACPSGTIAQLNKKLYVFLDVCGVVPDPANIISVWLRDEPDYLKNCKKEQGQT